jgi:hypothetical protein
VSNKSLRDVGGGSKTPRVTRSSKVLPAAWFGVAAFLVSSLVFWPDHRAKRIQVPVPSTNGEVSLQQYFTAQGEMIGLGASGERRARRVLAALRFHGHARDERVDGGERPGLVQRARRSERRPTALYPLLPPSARVTGQTFMGSDIRQSPDYAGGLIGFALTNASGLAVYYSEYRRNPNLHALHGCRPTGAQQMPGYWRMMLAYPSTKQRSSYYLGFEDWPNANDSSWQDNDGDFQDKVFLVTGVSCPAAESRATRARRDSAPPV